MIRVVARIVSNGIRVTVRIPAISVIPAADATANITVNGNTFTSEEIGSGESETINVPVINTATTAVGAIVGENVVIGNSTVSNSDASYSVNVAAEQPLVLPNISVTDSDGSVNANYPAVQNVVCAPCEVISRIYAYPPPTGQTTSYATGDDAWVQQNYFNALPSNGRLVTLASFLVLNENNVFGNTSRVTDSLGSQLYGSGNAALANYLIDHYTGLGWIRVQKAGGLSWATNIANAIAATDLLLSGWFLPSLNHFKSIINQGVNGQINYSPFNYNTTTRLWSSTTHPNDPNSALIYNSASSGSGGGSFFSQAKSSTLYGYFLCRKHF